MSAVARNIFAGLSVTLALAIGGPAALGGPSGSNEAAGSKLARDVYRVTDQSGKILLTFPALGPELGRGGLGIVHQADVQMVDGTTNTVAVKLLQPEAYGGSAPSVGSAPATPSGPSNPSTTSPFHESHRHLARYFQRRPPPHIHAEVGGLLLHAPDGSVQPTTISEVVSGNVYQQMESLRMYPHTRDIPLRIERLHQLMRDSADGVIELAAVNLMHGDIKPANIFVKDGSRYLLADLDQITPIGKPALSASVSYMTPEFFARGEVVASTARDIYALANSLYQVAFGELPWREYLYSDPASLKRFHELILQRLNDPGAFKLKLRSSTVEQFRAYIQQGQFDAFHPGSRLWQIVYADRDLFGSALIQALQELMSDSARYEKYLAHINAQMVQRFRDMGARGMDLQRLVEIQGFIYRGLQHQPEKRAQALRIAGTSKLPREPHCAAQFGGLFDRLFLAAFPKQ